MYPVKQREFLFLIALPLTLLCLSGRLQGESLAIIWYVVLSYSIISFSAWLRLWLHRRSVLMHVMDEQDNYQPTLEHTERMIGKLKYGVDRANELLKETGAGYQIKIVRKTLRSPVPAQQTEPPEPHAYPAYPAPFFGMHYPYVVMAGEDKKEQPAHVEKPEEGKGQAQAGESSAKPHKAYPLAADARYEW